ncbi:MAG: pyridoxal-phosphate dependent enzyme [Deltaproteobacteria bacterium]|nr:pyridoxal-phosphate dependent enzyme [Deltaproteobacteria bacterium]
MPFKMQVGISNSLFERWPALEGRLPFTYLGSQPTPVEPIDGIGDQAGAKIWVKRDDQTSARFGGNKVRKLEFLLAGSNRPVLTFGPLGSHHVLATAIYAHECGRPCVGVLVPQPMTEHHTTVHRLIERHCDFTVRLEHPLSAVRDLVSFGRDAARAHFGKGVTVIWPGGSSARGTLGYVAGGLEMAGQIRRGECPLPRRIYVALGTGGTAAGLALGLALQGLDSEVVAVRVASRATGSRPFLRILARRALGLLCKAGLDVREPRLRLTIDHRFIGSGYARVTKESADLVEQGRKLGLPLETTYTGKALAALVADRRADPEGGPLMFVNTSGPINNLDTMKNRNQEKTR